MVRQLRLAMFLASVVVLALSGNQRLFGQNLIYGLNGDVPATRVGTDTYSMYARHVFANGTEQRTLSITVTPLSGPPQVFLVLVGDAQIISAGITKALALQADNGGVITQGGQTLRMRLEGNIVMPAQAGGFTMNSNSNGIWYMSYQAAFSRRYPSVLMQQFADYLSLGVAFANALP